MNTSPRILSLALTGCLAAFLCISVVFAVATNSGVITLRTNANSLHATNDILRDIRGPFEIQTPWTWVWRALIATVLALLAWWAWNTWKKRRDDLAGPQLSPAERARNRLRELLAIIHQPVPFVTAVSETARVYLEERFGLKAPERTTEEFLAELSQSIALDARHKALLADFLTRADLVKFAQYDPNRIELEELHNAALRLVDETSMPQLAPQGSPTANATNSEQVDEGTVPPLLSSESRPAQELIGDERFLPPEDYSFVRGVSIPPASSRPRVSPKDEVQT